VLKQPKAVRYAFKHTLQSQTFPEGKGVETIKGCMRAKR